MNAQLEKEEREGGGEFWGSGGDTFGEDGQCLVGYGLKLFWRLC